MRSNISSVVFLAVVTLHLPRLTAQSALPATTPNSVSLPKPAVELTAGISKYKLTDVQTDGTYSGTYSITIKDDGSMWTATSHWETPDGPVTDIQTLEKGTLLLRKESLKHFPKPGQPWKALVVNLDFKSNKAIGTMKYASGQEKPVEIDLGGPVFAGNASSNLTIGCLPLSDGYSATMRNFDMGRLVANQQASDKEKLVQLRVVGMERVTVPAGTFDSFKIELTSPDGSDKGTVWIAKDSRLPVKSSGSQVVGRGTVFTTTELIP